MANFATYTMTMTGALTLEGPLSGSVGGDISGYTSVTLTNNATSGDGLRPLLLLGSTQTWTSGGYTYGGAVQNQSVSAIITMVGNFSVNQLTVASKNVTFSGAYNATIGTLNLYSEGSSFNFIFPAGQTLAVSNALNIQGSYSTFAPTVKSPSTTPFFLNYNGPLNAQNVYQGIFQYVNASNGKYPIFNWYGGASSTGNTNVLYRDPTYLYRLTSVNGTVSIN
jgi:hypothetical protein